MVAQASRLCLRQEFVVGLFLPDHESYRLNKLDTQFTILDRNMIASDKVLAELEDMLFKVRAFKPRNEKQRLQQERIESRMFQRCQVILQSVAKIPKKADQFQ